MSELFHSQIFLLVSRTARMDVTAVYLGAAITGDRYFRDIVETFMEQEH